MTVALQSKTSKDLNPDFSIIVPIYRGGNKIGTLLRRIREMFVSIPGSTYEIIVVNDGSDDNTLSILELEKDSNLRIISYDNNKGKGYAVRRGILESIGRNVIYMDGDLDVLPISIKEFVDGLKTHDLVIGSKSHPMSQVDIPLSRRFFSFLFNFLVRKATDIRLLDTQTGLKAGRGDLLRKIFGAMDVNGYAFDVEFLCVAGLLDLGLKEAPVMIKHSNSFKLSQSVKMLCELLAISYKLKIKHSYQKKFKGMALSVLI